MMRFRKKTNCRSQLAFCYGGVTAALFVVLLLVSNSASGYQASPTEADQNGGSSNVVKATASNARQKKLSDSRIVELKAFAKSHHPEIIPLLDYLEKKRHRRFLRVMNGLHRDVSNLERLQKRSAEAYEWGLAMWINQSRIQLYAAQIKVADDDATASDLREKIKVLIEENLDTRVKQLESEIASSRKKIARLQKASESIQSNRDAMVEKRITAVTKNAVRMRKVRKSPAKTPKSPKSEKAAGGEAAANPSSTSEK